jgi:CRP-like cAMP-binding protein
MASTNTGSSCTVVKKHCECFEYLTAEQKKLIEDKHVIVEYKKGEVIARQGAFASHIIQIVDGMARVMYEDGNENIILRISTPGSLIGLTTLSDENKLFGYTAKAYVTTKVKLIDNKLFVQLIKDNSMFGYAIIKILSQISHQKNERFYGLTHRQSFGKLADLLLCMSSNIFFDNKFELPLSRKEIAELAGMSTESVIRTLKKFQDDKLITISGKTIEIIDFDGLDKVFKLG